MSGSTTNHSLLLSLASKCLHFHWPVVPIYDSYAAARLSKPVHWDSHEAFVGRSPGADAEYRSFCVRFLRYYRACLNAGLAGGVKSLDTYLWAVPVAK